MQFFIKSSSTSLNKFEFLSQVPDVFPCMLSAEDIAANDRWWFNFRNGSRVAIDGGYQSVDGQFVGFTRAVEISSAYPVSLWGDTEKEDAEFSSSKASRHPCWVSVCVSKEIPNHLIVSSTWDAMPQKYPQYCWEA